MNEWFYHPLFGLARQRCFVTRALTAIRLHEVFVGAEIGEGNGCMLDRVLLQVPLDGFQEERSDLFLDQLVPKDLVEAQVGEVAATLAVMLYILSVLQHVHHEFDCVVCSHLLVAI